MDSRVIGTMGFPDDCHGIALAYVSTLLILASSSPEATSTSDVDRTPDALPSARVTSHIPHSPRDGRTVVEGMSICPEAQRQRRIANSLYTPIELNYSISGGLDLE